MITMYWAKPSHQSYVDSHHVSCCKLTYSPVLPQSFVEVKLSHFGSLMEQRHWDSTATPVTLLCKTSDAQSTLQAKTGIFALVVFSSSSIKEESGSCALQPKGNTSSTFSQASSTSVCSIRFFVKLLCLQTRSFMFLSVLELESSDTKLHC